MVKLIFPCGSSTCELKWIHFVVGPEEGHSESFTGKMRITNLCVPSKLSANVNMCIFLPFVSHYRKVKFCMGIGKAYLLGNSSNNNFKSSGILFCQEPFSCLPPSVTGDKILKCVSGKRV